MPRPCPVGAIGRGLVAGALGTAAMTAYQTAVAKARGSEPSTTPAEVAKPEELGLEVSYHLVYGAAVAAAFAALRG